MNNLLKVGAGERTRRLSLLSALQRAWVQFPGHTRRSTVPRDLAPSSGFHGLPHVCGAHKPVQAFTLVHINKNKLSFKVSNVQTFGIICFLSRELCQTICFQE